MRLGLVVRRNQAESGGIRPCGPVEAWLHPVQGKRINKYGSELVSGTDKRCEVGHLMGDQFGGPPEQINTVAMLEEMNQTRVGKESNSHLRLEQKMAASPEGCGHIVVELECPDPVDPSKLTDAERVPDGFEVTWIDSDGVPDHKGFENPPEEARSLGDRRDMVGVDETACQVFVKIQGLLRDWLTEEGLDEVDFEYSAIALVRRLRRLRPGRMRSRLVRAGRSDLVSDSLA